MADIIPKKLRELVGVNTLMMIGPYGELEAAVAATTKLRLAGTVFDAAGDAVMPVSGWVVGMVVQSEASSNFTLQFTKNGTADTTNTVTVNAAKVYDLWEPIAFAANDTIGVKVIADTVSKDVSAWVLVVLDFSGVEY